MTRSEMYSVGAYRYALFKILHEDYSRKALYISSSSWNGDDMQINPMLFLADRIHLNCGGYSKLDERIAITIGEDYLHSR